MTSTSRTNLSKLLGSCLVALFFIPIGVSAQSGLSLSISPTLFEISASPEQTWSSSVKVINSNPFEIRVSTEVVNFTPKGEGGQGTFVPIFSFETQGQTMAEWIALDNTEVVIPPEQTVQIPFTVTVPESAPPGGHYAALLIGTKSDSGFGNQSRVETSQVVSSLLFLRVAGDITEIGDIREFITEKSIYESPNVRFELRFENKGNVHIQPQGDIKILNMWGQERGIIPVNQRSLFGKVLPDSVRKYNFTWTGEWSMADIGRYSAIATLGYGEDEKQFTTAVTHFWIIPWKVLGSIILVLIGFIWLFTWGVKMYVKKMLLLAGVSPELQSMKRKRPKVARQKVSLVAPIEAGILDLRSRFHQSENWKSSILILFTAIKTYQVFIIVVAATLTFICAIVLYVLSASAPERSYEITVDSATGDVQITSDDARFEELNQIESDQAAVDLKEFPAIELVNRSGLSGLAGELKFELEVNGYAVANVRNEFGVSENRTVIVYDPEYATQALELSQFIGETLLSSYADSSELEFPITVFVGSDQVNAVE